MRKGTSTARHLSNTSSDALKRVWSEYQHLETAAGHETGLLRALREQVAPGTKVLEVGIGSGRATRLLQADEPRAHFYGIDLTDACRSAPGRVAQADARRLPFRDCVFDIVFSLGVVEHFPETALAIREHARVTRPGGFVLVTTPRLSLLTIERWSRFVRRQDYRRGTFEMIYGRNLRLSQVKQFFRDAGLEVLMAETCGSDFRGHTFRSRLKRIVPSWLWHPFLYCIGRKPAKQCGGGDCIRRVPAVPGAD